MKVSILFAVLCLSAYVSATETVDSSERSFVPTCPDYCTYKSQAEKDCRGLYPYCEVVRCGKHKFKCTYRPSPTPTRTPTPSPKPTKCPDDCVYTAEARKQCRYLRDRCEVVSCGRGYSKCAPKKISRCKNQCRGGREGRAKAIHECEGHHPYCVVQPCDYGFYCADNPLYH